MRAILFGFVIGTLFSGCGKDGYDISGPATVATGIPFTIRVGDACPQPHTKGLSSLCFDDPVTAIDSATVAPPFQIDRQEIVGINAEFDLRAASEGDAELKLALQGSLGRHINFSHAISAHDIDEVSVRPRCEGLSTEPLWVFAGQPLLFDFELRGDGLTLFAGDHFPFASSVGKPTLFMPGVGQLDTPATPQTVTLTSSITPSPRLSLSTIDITRPDSVVLERDLYASDRPVPIGGSMHYTPKLRIGGEPPCVGPGSFAATYTIDTPTTCHFQDSGSPYFLSRNFGGVTAIAAAVGTCGLHVSVTGTPLVGRAEFAIIAAQ